MTTPPPSSTPWSGPSPGRGGVSVGTPPHPPGTGNTCLSARRRADTADGALAGAGARVGQTADAGRTHRKQVAGTGSAPRTTPRDASAFQGQPQNFAPTQRGR